MPWKCNIQKHSNGNSLACNAVDQIGRPVKTSFRLSILRGIVVLVKCYLACEYNLAFKISTSHSLEVRGIEYSSKVKSLV